MASDKQRPGSGANSDKESADAIELLNDEAGSHSPPPEVDDDTINEDSMEKANQAHTESTSRRSPDPPQATGDTQSTIDDVRDVVQQEFDNRIWYALEAVLSAQATLLIANVQKCPGLVLVGPPSAGKTTVLDLTDTAVHDERDLTFRSDDFTPASLVSHDASRTDEELRKDDLLPAIRHRALLIADMGPLFAGNSDTIHKRMSTLARVMDGTGYTRHSGRHGERGYEGDFRFALIGATTPLSNRAWTILGTVGNRLLFQEVPGPADLQQVTNDVFDETEFAQKKEHCGSVVSRFLSNRWAEEGGYGSVEWDRSAIGEIEDLIGYLANLITFARAPTGHPTREGPHRVMQALRDLARGHALLCSRNQVEMSDMAVCSRVTLSTMYWKRRGIIRAVVDPEVENPITATDILEHDAVDASRKTVITRMEELANIGLGEVKQDGTGRETRLFELGDQFAWPAQLSYPRFWAG